MESVPEVSQYSCIMPKAMGDREEWTFNLLARIC